MERWNLKKLGHFVRVARATSLSAAAREMDMSQSALTQSIRGLEAELGFALFDRERGFELTGLGRELLPRAEEALATIADLDGEMAGLVEGRLGTLRIGCGPTVADGVLGPALGRMIGSCGGASITVTVGRFPEFAKLLKKREIDLLVGEASTLAGDPELVIRPLAPEEVVFFCRAGHPLAGRARVTPVDFFSFPHVATDLPPWIMEWLGRIRPPGSDHPGITLTSSQHAVLKRVVETSDALSGAPLRVVEPELTSGRLALVRLAAKPIYNQASVVHLRDRGLSPLAERLIAELAAAASGPPPPARGGRARA
jgi:DNA-binding transcriptional LysR family regulator